MHARRVEQFAWMPFVLVAAVTAAATQSEGFVSLSPVADMGEHGKKMNEGHDIEPAEGNICLQSEGWPVFYRNLEVKRLD